jgi:hypothetical protein
MIFSEHARKRLRQRFPEMIGVRILEELESAMPPTPDQARLIAVRSKKKSYKTGKRVVSKSGVVFVIDQDSVITLFPLPSEDEFERIQRRNRTRAKPLSNYEKRRAKEKPWLELDEE